MTALKLRADCLANPNGLDVLRISSMMLWPDDLRARLAARSAGVVDILKPLRDRMSREQLEDYAEFAAESPRLVSVQETARERWLDGCVAGAMLHQAVEAWLEWPNSAPMIGSRLP
jgi:hypothetical protein